MNDVIHPNPLLDFFYTRACDRINKRYDKKERPKLASLHEANPKIIGNILNKTISKNDNPYLITPTAIEVLIREEFFTNATEMLWGSKDEINEYIEPLFYLFWNTYVLNSEEIFSPYMYDYLPYAEHWIYKEQIINQNEEKDKYFSEALFNTSKKELLEREKSIISETMNYIYRKNQDWFRKEWSDFTKKTKTYTKLDKKLDEFAQNEFLSNITTNIPTVKSSVGLRAKALLENDLCVKDKEIKFGGYNNEEEHIKFLNFMASLSHLKELEKISKLQQQKDSP